MNNPKTAAIFDLDGTLFTGHFWQGIVEHNMKHRVRVLPTIAYLASHYPLWIGHKLGLISEESFKTKWGQDLSLLLKGLTAEQIERVFKWIEDSYFTRRLRPDMVDLLQRHHSQGHVTIILSGSFQGFLEVARSRLGADYAVGSRLRMDGHRCSGVTEKPLCFGKNKVTLLRQSISNLGLELDFGASFAYADSLTDVPVLEMVGNPVAAYADAGLVKLAGKKGWRVLPA